MDFFLASQDDCEDDDDDDHQLKIFFCQNEMDKCEKNDTHTHTSFQQQKHLLVLTFFYYFLSISMFQHWT